MKLSDLKANTSNCVFNKQYGFWVDKRVFAFSKWVVEYNKKKTEDEQSKN